MALFVTAQLSIEDGKLRHKPAKLPERIKKYGRKLPYQRATGIPITPADPFDQIDHFPAKSIIPVP